MHPSPMEVASIYGMWKDNFGFDDGGSIDDYFQRNFACEHCYILKEENQIIATLCAHPHTIMLQHQRYDTMFISGVITHCDYRHQGVMKRLFNMVMNAHPDCFLWMLQAYQPSIYEGLGFTASYPYHRYLIDRPLQCNNTITSNLQPTEMMVCASNFLQAYDGYENRDLAWYENNLLEAKAQGQSIYGIFNHQELLGYAKMSIANDRIIIDEIIYQNEQICYDLIAHATSFQKMVQVDLYPPMQLSFPYTLESGAMVKLGKNNTQKNILSHLDQDVFVHHKPLYHYGYW